MFDAAAHLATIYDSLGEPATPAVGAPFLVLFSVADAEQFGGIQSGGFELRYPAASASLAEGARVTVRGVEYRVAQPPRRIGDGLEMIADLVEV